MSISPDASIDSTIQTFVAEITSLVSSAALEAVQAALGGDAPGRRGPGRPKGSGKRRGPGRPPKAMVARPTRGGPRVRRWGADVAATAQKMLAYVKANDGKRLDEIAKALGTSTADLTNPSHLLLASKAVKRSGQRRGTKYHLAGG